MNGPLESFFKLNSKNAIAEPETVFIYGLNCPTTGKCRYVGKANDPRRRFRKHLQQAPTKQTHRDCWICGLAAQGLKPVLEVIDEVPKAEWEFWEQEYIRVFKMIGFSLTNLTDGGEGISGVTEQTRAKMSTVQMGKKHSPETRAKISAAQMGRVHSPETRAKMSVAQKGRKLSPEHCAKMSAARRGKKPSPETCAARMGRKLSPEHCAKLSASRLGKKRSPETCAKISAAKLGKKRLPFSEEHRAKLSAAHKAAWKRRNLSGGICGA